MLDSCFEKHSSGVLNQWKFLIKHLPKISKKSRRINSNYREKFGKAQLAYRDWKVVQFDGLLYFNKVKSEVMSKSLPTLTNSNVCLCKKLSFSFQQSELKFNFVVHGSQHQSIDFFKKIQHN